MQHFRWTDVYVDNIIVQYNRELAEAIRQRCRTAGMRVIVGEFDDRCDGRARLHVTMFWPEADVDDMGRTAQDAAATLQAGGTVLVWRNNQHDVRSRYMPTAAQTMLDSNAPLLELVNTPGSSRCQIVDDVHIEEVVVRNYHASREASYGLETSWFQRGWLYRLFRR